MTVSRGAALVGKRVQCKYGARSRISGYIESVAIKPTQWPPLQSPEEYLAFIRLTGRSLLKVDIILIIGH